MNDENIFEIAPRIIRSITFVLIDLFKCRIVYQSNDTNKCSLSIVFPTGFCWVKWFLGAKQCLPVGSDSGWVINYSIYGLLYIQGLSTPFEECFSHCRLVPLNRAYMCTDKCPLHFRGPCLFLNAYLYMYSCMVESHQTKTSLSCD